MERVGARDRGLDRIETVALEFHERVARAFQTFATQKWQEAHPECGPIALIDATGSEPDVFALVLAELHARWPGNFPLPD
jgi:thymidylate kinase